VQLSQLRAQLNEAKSGLLRIEDFLTEVNAENSSLSLIASTALLALQTCFAFSREIGESILELRISCLDADQNGRSEVVGRFVLGRNVTALHMTAMRQLVLDAIATNECIVRRIVLEACDGEHFGMLWGDTVHASSSWRLWEVNEKHMKAVMKALLDSLGFKKICPNALAGLKQQLFNIFVLRIDQASGFSVKRLPRPNLSPIAAAVQRAGLGGGIEQNVFLSRLRPEKGSEVWDKYAGSHATARLTARPELIDNPVLVAETDEVDNFISLSHQTGPPGAQSREESALSADRENARAWSQKAGEGILNTLPGLRYASSTDNRNVVFCSAFQWVQYQVLAGLVHDSTSKIELFFDAVAKQNFNIIAEKAQSESRIAVVMEVVRRGLEIEKEPGGDSTKAGILQDILDVLNRFRDEGVPNDEDETKRTMTDADAFRLLLTNFHLHQLDVIVQLYDTLRFSERVWFPQDDATLKKTLCKAEDFFHKLKRVMSAVRTQKKTTKKGALPAVDTLGPPMFDRDVLLDVARKQPDKFKLVISALTGLQNDCMNPATEKQMFIDLDFIDAVKQAGYEDMAFFLSIIGEWFTAQDTSGLSQVERERRLNNGRELFRCVFKDLWWGHIKPAANVAGLPVRLWYAIAANVESLDHLLNIKMGSEPDTTAQDPACPTVQQGHCCLKRSPLFKKLSSRLIKLRYCGTYDLEGGFATLVMLVGFKPACRIAIGVLRRASILTGIRLNPSRNFFMQQSKRSHYLHNVAESIQRERAADEWFGRMGFVKDTKRDVQRKNTSMKRQGLLPRDFAKNRAK
jgi:hypothetical protein